MELRSVRSLEEQKSVLLDKTSFGNDPVYWVFSKVMMEKWENLTVISPGLYGTEFPKTFGHYHSYETVETYKVLYGEGVLLLQKRHMEEGILVPEVVEKVVLVKAGVGDELSILPDYGHAWSNIGSGPLVTLDDWKTGHLQLDYELVKKQAGMSYFLTSSQGKVVPAPNPAYRDLPEPAWLTPDELKSL